MLDWNDLQYLLAVSRHGSMKNAAKALKTDPTTVSRHVKKLTKVSKSTLLSFEREGSWRITDAGRQIVELAENFDLGIQEYFKSTEVKTTNSYTISTLEFIAESYLAPSLKRLPSRISASALSIDCDDRCASLAYGEADLALRFSRPTDGKLVVSRLGSIQMGVYSSGKNPSKDWIGLSKSYNSTPEMQMGLDYFGREPSIRLGSFRAIRKASISTGLSCIGPAKTMGRLRNLDERCKADREVWSAIHESRKHDETLSSIRLWAKRCFEKHVPDGRANENCWCQSDSAA